MDTLKFMMWNFKSLTSSIDPTAADKMPNRSLSRNKKTTNTCSEIILWTSSSKVQPIITKKWKLLQQKRLKTPHLIIEERVRFLVQPATRLEFQLKFSLIFPEKILSSQPLAALHNCCRWSLMIPVLRKKTRVLI